MDDLKKGYREAKDEAKEAWRRSDGDESVADKIGNAGDDIRRGLGNAGDDIDDEVDKREAERRESGAYRRDPMTDEPETERVRP